MVPARRHPQESYTKKVFHRFALWQSWTASPDNEPTPLEFLSNQTHFASTDVTAKVATAFFIKTMTNRTRMMNNRIGHHRCRHRRVSVRRSIPQN
jgi:hypothetical protein